MISDELSNAFNNAIKEMEKEQEEYWSSLTPEQQLMAFCCISRRIVKGEIQEQGSYRYVLYDIFGWGPEAYLPAQVAGYLTIHNSIYPDDHDPKLIRKFCEEREIDISDDDIRKFLGYYVRSDDQTTS